MLLYHDGFYNMKAHEVWSCHRSTIVYNTRSLPALCACHCKTATLARGHVSWSTTNRLRSKVTGGPNITWLFSRSEVERHGWLPPEVVRTQVIKGGCRRAEGGVATPCLNPYWCDWKIILLTLIRCLLPTSKPAHLLRRITNSLKTSTNLCIICITYDFL